jgi:ankyrin repeat protein
MKTPLTWACIRGFTPIAKMLLEMGALHNKKDHLGHSALFYAIHYKNEECVKLLILH